MRGLILFLCLVIGLVLLSNNHSNAEQVYRMTKPVQPNMLPQANLQAFKSSNLLKILAQTEACTDAHNLYLLLEQSHKDKENNCSLLEIQEMFRDRLRHAMTELGSVRTEGKTREDSIAEIRAEWGTCQSCFDRLAAKFQAEIDEITPQYNAAFNACHSEPPLDAIESLLKDAELNTCERCGYSWPGPTNKQRCDRYNPAN